MTYATVEDIAAELGRLPTSVSDAERAQWTRWLDRVERSITARFTRAGLVLSEQIALGNPDAAAVADVEVAAVVRKIDNPTGDTSTTITVDDASVTRRKEGAGTFMGLDLTDAEWELLLPPTPGGAFSVTPYRDAEPSLVEWLLP